MNTLNLAIQAHKNNKLEEAKGYYRKHLALHSKDANAKQLLGLIYCVECKFDVAQVLLEESIQINPNQPHVLTNLANCKHRLGDDTQAITLYQKAIELNKNYIEAYKNLALTYQTIGERRQALEILNDALKVKPHDVNILKLQGLISKETENFALSVSSYEQVLNLQPEAIVARHNLAVSLRLAGRSDEALIHYLELESNGLNNYQLKHNIANAYSDLGKLLEAVEYYKKALILNHSYVDAHKNLNDLLWELNDHEAYLGSYRQAMLIDSSNLELHFSYVDSLIRASNYQDAHSFLLQLSDGFKQNAEYYSLLARCLIRLGDKEKAVSIQELGVSFEDVNLEQRVNLARNLIETGNIDSAELQLQKVLEIDPYDQMAIAYLADCWRLKGDKRQYEINNYRHLVREYNLEQIGDYKDIKLFCKELNEYLVTLHSAKQQPLEQTLYRGTQTRANLFDNKNLLIQQFIQKATECIEDYKQKVKKIPGVTLGLKNLDQFFFSGSWSVKLREQGFHVSHVHPMGRLSCCFYIELPSVVENDGDNQGWFKLGEPNLELEPKLEAVQFVKPTVGKLVIFPSYMWHGTVPFSTDESRLTIAFDVASLS